MLPNERAIQLISEAKIKAAMEEGKFDNLEGFGKPFEFDDTRYDPHWWVRRKVERERIQHIFRATPKIDLERQA